MPAPNHPYWPDRMARLITSFQTNFVGAYIAWRRPALGIAGLLFLSTSRVYPVARLEAHPFREEATRFSGKTPAHRHHFARVAGKCGNDRRPLALRIYQARCRTTHRGIPRRFWFEGGHQPLRRHRRTVALAKWIRVSPRFGFWPTLGVRSATSATAAQENKSGISCMWTICAGCSLNKSGILTNGTAGWATWRAD